MHVTSCLIGFFTFTDDGGLISERYHVTTFHRAVFSVKKNTQKDDKDYNGGNGEEEKAHYKHAGHDEGDNGGDSTIDDVFNGMHIAKSWKVCRKLTVVRLRAYQPIL